jgi:hypothetical protein
MKYSYLVLFRRERDEIMPGPGVLVLSNHKLLDYVLIPCDGIVEHTSTMAQREY